MVKFEEFENAEDIEPNGNERGVNEEIQQIEKTIENLEKITERLDNAKMISPEEYEIEQKKIREELTNPTRRIVE
ncbi:MAG TPA: hypothetical protein VJG85_01305 [Patescibacteria group bacterium]|nr:hypothetical protein [Patescibacteria group bacterium]